MASFGNVQMNANMNACGTLWMISLKEEGQFHNFMERLVIQESRFICPSTVFCLAAII